MAKMTKKKRAYRGRAMERFKRREVVRMDAPPAYFVTQIGKQAIASTPMRDASPWTQATYALIRESQAEMPADVAPGPAYILMASDMLEKQWGEAACWERLDVAAAARFAQLHLRYPGIASEAAGALMTFLSFLRGTGRLSVEPGDMMAS